MTLGNIKRILIGFLSRALLQIEVTENATTLIGTIGVGDPEDPLWSGSLVSTVLDAGSHNIVKDITDQYEWLPAQAGEERWFIELDASSTIEVTQAYVSYGQELEVAETPNTIWSNSSEIILFPSPPNYYLQWVSPSSVSPGDQEIPISLNVYNLASPSQGEVMASLVAVDSSVTVHNGKIFSLMITLGKRQSFIP